MDDDAKKGIRLDSGDLSYLSAKAREMLDNEGLTDVNIVASNSLDEYKIAELEHDKNAAIDFYGVGERMITAKSDPVFGGVYKLTAVEKDEEISPRIKLSEDVGKITNPGVKEVWRLFDNDTGKAFADLLTLKGETIGEEYKLFNEFMPWKKKVVSNFTPQKLQEPIIKNGSLVYDFPTLEEIREYRAQEVNKLWDTLLKFKSPDKYFVNLSFDLWAEKNRLLKKFIEDTE
jgi:nicotinate phosphoribosyltransferase